MTSNPKPARQRGSGSRLKSPSWISRHWRIGVVMLAGLLGLAIVFVLSTDDGGRAPSVAVRVSIKPSKCVKFGRAGTVFAIAPGEKFAADAVRGDLGEPFLLHLSKRNYSFYFSQLVEQSRGIPLLAQAGDPSSRVIAVTGGAIQLFANPVCKLERAIPS